MMDEPEEPAQPTANGVTGRGLRRLQFELALDLSLPAGKPVKETLAHAAETAGVDLLFVLPTQSGKGTTAVVRVIEEGSDSFLQVRTADDGFAISDQEQMDKTLLGLARASVDVLQRMSADRAIRDPIATSA